MHLEEYSASDDDFSNEEKDFNMKHELYESEDESRGVCLFILQNITIVSCFLSDLKSKFVQSTGVKGIFLCKGVPAKDVQIKIWDTNRITKDEMISDGVSDEKGRFGIRAVTYDYFANGFYYTISHKCGYENQVCKMTVKEKIDNKYINKEKFAEKVVDAGKIELATIKKGEKDCLT
uniref:Carboxypeptidase regulatory-like domain-containing protein n=1 Tax=Rhabditophanes sp. KR3021 TaxID=114890 RepID=A0AC35U0M1_9BILA